MCLRDVPVEGLTKSLHDPIASRLYQQGAAVWRQDPSVSPHSWVLSVSTCIFSDLVMKLVEINFVVCHVVVLEDVMSLCARRVHVSRLSEARGVKRRRRESGVVAPGFFNEKN